MIHPVFLVGAGPGDPGLITVRGQQVLEAAEVVIADRLVPEALLEELRADVRAEVIVRGERRSLLSQEEISALLVEKAREGKRVVRLKGGDPFVFGRGGEEAEALSAAGVPFVVVPGVTAAIAAPAYAGIPVTHRGVSGAVAFVTGHEADDKHAGAVDWEALARGAATLVLYMSVSHLEPIAQRLLDAGRPPSTAVAIIERGTTRRQRTIVGTLADIVEKARAAKVEPPALTIVGEVVRLRHGLEWFESRPLAGRRVLMVSAIGDGEPPPEAMGEAEAELSELGAEVTWGHPLRVHEHPEALRDALAELAAFRWIAFTSHRGALAFGHALEEANLDGRALAGVRIACLAGRSAALLRSQLQLRPDLTAAGGGRALAEALLAADPALPSSRVLFPRAAEGRDELPSILQAAGARVDVVAAYETRVDEEEVRRLCAQHARAPFHAAGLGSPRGARALLDAGLDLGGAIVGAIGATTAGALREAGVTAAVVPDEPSYAALLRDLGRALAARPVAPGAPIG